MKELIKEVDNFYKKNALLIEKLDKDIEKRKARLEIDKGKLKDMESMREKLHANREE